MHCGDRLFMKIENKSGAAPPFTLPRDGTPLAARMRPRRLDEFIGQEHILGEGKLLRRAIQADQLGSIILWGPPGCGKTTLARVISNTTRAEFETLNAVLAADPMPALPEKFQGDHLGVYLDFEY